jgi:hypothetical protein
MLRLASDADVHGAIIRGLHRRLPELNLVRVQDSLSEGTPDPEILAWAASEDRILITNDRNTMVAFSCKRVAAGEPMPGLIVTTTEQSIGSAIDDIQLLAECMPEEEVRDHTRSYFFPCEHKMYPGVGTWRTGPARRHWAVSAKSGQFDPD